MRSMTTASLIAAIHLGSTRGALDAVLMVWAAAEVVLRVAHRDASLGSDWTLPVVIGSVVAGINLGFRAAGVPGATIANGAALGWIGVGLLTAGAALRLFSILTLGRLFTFAVTVQAEHHVVERGPYHYVRHPSYAGGLLGLVGAGIALDNWLSVAALLLLPLAGVVVRIRYEEAQLRRGLGQPYVDYAARTARLIPGLW